MNSPVGLVGKLRVLAIAVLVAAGLAGPLAAAPICSNARPAVCCPRDAGVHPAPCCELRAPAADSEALVTARPAPPLLTLSGALADLEIGPPSARVAPWSEASPRARSAGLFIIHGALLI